MKSWLTSFLEKACTRPDGKSNKLRRNFSLMVFRLMNTCSLWLFVDDRQSIVTSMERRIRNYSTSFSFNSPCSIKGRDSAIIVEKNLYTCTLTLEYLNTSCRKIVRVCCFTRHFEISLATTRHQRHICIVKVWNQCENALRICIVKSFVRVEILTFASHCRQIPNYTPHQHGLSSHLVFQPQSTSAASTSRETSETGLAHS